MAWKNQLRKAPFGPFKRKKPEPQPAETPEDAKEKKLQKLRLDALNIITRADAFDTSEAFFGENEKRRRSERLLDKTMKFQEDNHTHLGKEGIEGLKSFIGYLERSADSNAIAEGARKALSFVEQKEGEFQ
jgi:hypothetical protein